MKDNIAACDFGLHSGHSTEEKIKRNFPGPDRRFHHGLTVVTGFARNRATGNVHAFARNDALLPSFLAETLETFLGLRFVRHAIFRGAHAPRVPFSAPRRKLPGSSKNVGRGAQQSTRERVRSPDIAACARRSFISEKMRMLPAPR